MRSTAAIVPIKAETLTNLRLLPDHWTVLDYLVKQEFGYFVTFSHIEDETGFTRKRARFICRSLARKGLAQYSNGLFADDGSVCGSGYAATAAGRTACVDA